MGWVLVLLVTRWLHDSNSISILQNSAFRNIAINFVEGCMTGTFLKWRS